jgi:hypothetical protein
MKLFFYNKGHFSNFDEAKAAGAVYGDIYLNDEAAPSFARGAGADAYEVAEAVNKMAAGADIAYFLLSDSGEVLDSIND